MHRIGIMQGRLTPSAGRGIQFFPFENWEMEFDCASEIGLSEIEFIFDLERFEENPLWTRSGIERINDIVRKTGVAVNAICFDYFMRRPFYKEQDLELREARRNENLSVLIRIMDAAKSINAKLIEIPLVDNSSIKSEEEKEAFKSFLIEVLTHDASDIQIGLETDFPPGEFLQLLEGINSPRVKANYDSGNSSGIGYNHYEEISTYGHYIENIHIKDRIYRGTTVQLGTGSADFSATFKAIAETGYKGNFILQAARGDDGDERETVKAQMAFVQRWIDMCLA